ncbi:MAG: hypothetical protein LBJ96_00195 [Holosporaceae bacterium]|nr:hypothetical protein [Holosporaceae bacterium]
MRVIGCFCFALCVFNAFSEDSAEVGEKPKVVEPASENKKIEPKVYVDISKSARENAVSFDGVRGIFGVSFSGSNFQSSVGESSNYTNISSNLMEVYLGVEYSKSFKKGFLLAVDIGTDISKNKKSDGGWGEINREYEAQRGRFYPDRTGKFEKNAMCPAVSLKCGYLLNSLESVLFLKLAVSRLSGVYTYNSVDREVCKVSSSSYVPAIGLGFERKINKKWGASLEASVSIERKSKRLADTVDHAAKIKRADVKMMAIYSISD